MVQQADVQKAKSEQAEAARRATAELFQSKKPAEKEQTITINGEPVTILHRAIGRRDYDKLLTACPPSTAQRAAGNSYDQEKFAPQLLARVVVDPALSEVDWRNIWNDENWNRSELGDIFFAAVEVCSVGVNVDPTESVSG